MPISPFPQGTPLPNGDAVGRVLRALDEAFWVHKTQLGRRALLMTTDFAASVAPSLDGAEVQTIAFGGVDFRCLLAEGLLDTVDHLPRPSSAEEAMTFAAAMRSIVEPVRGLIFNEAGARLISFVSPSLPPRSKADVLGRYLTGGIEVPGDDVVSLSRILPKIDVEDLEAIAAAAGLAVKAVTRNSKAGRNKPATSRSKSDLKSIGRFELPGRQSLSDFFNEHVIDIVADEERYASLGIGFPGGIVLEGPTGCGKTFAVERLIEHLGWPSFSVEASSVASPYIHETSRKVSQVFAEAIKAAPSIIVIDEMDAFLSNRETGSQQHHVEEIAEFLRRIPEAAKNRVLVIGMTNLIDAIDPAILRRGRFDHVIHVDHAGRDEVAGLLKALLADIPNDLSGIGELAERLAGRPLSDVAFVVREAGRLTARARKDRVTSEEMAIALAKCPSRDADDQRKIGF